MTAIEPDYGRELYPFLYEGVPSAAGALDGVLAQVRQSTLGKCRDIVGLRRALLEEWGDLLVDAAGATADAFESGGKLLAFGNGGSATDAQDAAADCMAPPFPHWRPLPALALTNDIAVVTAVGNDIGFDNVFLRQVVAFSDPTDIVLGISTSGNSPNVVAALAEASRRGLLTIGFAGNDGGAMARAALDFCFVARVEHTPRIQEGHATIWHTLLELVQEELASRAAREVIA